jgi:predicted ATPase
MARLDRLGPAKELAQVGAAIGREFSHGLLVAVARKPETELASSLDSLNRAGLLFRKGAPPDAIYLFKHALVQEAAYGTMLRQPRRALHARIAETLENQFAEIADNQPELLARHWTEAGQAEKGAGLWGKAGQRSLERSALVEAAAQLARALDQIASLPGTPTLRREQIKLSVALTNALMHVKGHASSETKASLDQSRLYVERAEALGDALEDPLLLFSVLYGFWIANIIAFNGDTSRGLATQFLALAEKQETTVPLMIGHRMMGMCLLFTGDFAEGRAHFDRAIALYNPLEHRPLATRFAVDVGSTSLSYRSWAWWFLGHPEAALVDANDALTDAREMGHAVTLIMVLVDAAATNIFCGNYTSANLAIDELIALAEEKRALFWRANGMFARGSIFALTGKASEAVELITSTLAAYRSMGATAGVPYALSSLARAHAELGQFDDAWRSIATATSTMETTNERGFEAEVHRVAGEIALMSPERDAAKAEGYFDRALAIAREQQAKSWELRAATSLARLWRDQGKRKEACELLAPVYGWFTEGFDTRDLKEAKALLDELAS